MMEDYDFAIRLAVLGSWAYTDESLVICRDVANNKISEAAYANISKHMQTCIQIYDKYINDSSVYHILDLSHLKINRHLCVMKKESFRFISSKNIFAIFYRIILSSYLKIAKGIYRRFILLVRMKTKLVDV